MTYATYKTNALKFRARFGLGRLQCPKDVFVPLSYLQSHTSPTSHTSYATVL